MKERRNTVISTGEAVTWYSRKTLRGGSTRVIYYNNRIGLPGGNITLERNPRLKVKHITGKQ